MMLIDFLNTLFDRVFCWLPRFKIIDPEEMAVKVTLGVFRQNLENGVYWYWPLISSLNVLVVTEQIKLFDTQMMTLDGVSIEVVCDAVYAIDRPDIVILRFQDCDDTLASFAEHYLGEYICTHTLKEMLEATGVNGEYIGVHLAIRNYVYDKLEIVATRCGLNLLDINVRAFCEVYRVKTGD